MIRVFIPLGLLRYIEFLGINIRVSSDSNLVTYKERVMMNVYQNKNFDKSIILDDLSAIINNYQ